MKKIVFLMASNPDPRIIRKVETLSKEFSMSIIYWNRDESNFNIPFTTNINKDQIHSISLPNPYGKKIKRLLLTLEFFKRVRRLLMEIRPDAIHACGFDMAFLSYLIQFRHSVKIVYEVADIHSLMLKELIIRLQKLMMKKIDLLVLTSEGFWVNYFQKYGICTNEKKCLVIPNAPEKRIFREYVKENNRSTLTIGYCGLMRFKDQLKMLFEVVHALRAKNYNIDIFLAGSGIESDYVLEVSKECDFVRYLPRYNYQEDIARLNAGLDIVFCLYPANEIKKDVMANRFYDSIVSEVPIISPKGTWQGVLTERYDVGFTVDPADSDQLYNLLEQVYLAPERLKQIEKRCQELKPQFFYENFEQPLIQKYKAILD